MRIAFSSRKASTTFSRWIFLPAFIGEKASPDFCSSCERSRFRIEYKKQITEDENIYFNALLFNEIFELITDKDIYISITNQEGHKYNFEFSKVNNNYMLDIGKLAIGRYSFLVEVKGTSLSRSGGFEVKPIQLEQLSTVADHKLLFASNLRTY